MTPVAPHYPVTKEELEWIRSGVWATRMMEEVLARPDPLEVLEKWIEQNKLYMEIPKYTSDNHPDNVEYVYGTELLDIIKELRTNPDAVIARGKQEGWLP